MSCEIGDSLKPRFLQKLAIGLLRKIPTKHFKKQAAEFYSGGLFFVL